jgi:hypothetical protein
VVLIVLVLSLAPFFAQLTAECVLPPKLFLFKKAMWVISPMVSLYGGILEGQANSLPWCCCQEVSLYSNLCCIYGAVWSEARTSENFFQKVGHARGTPKDVVKILK